MYIHQGLEPFLPSLALPLPPPLSSLGCMKELSRRNEAWKVREESAATPAAVSYIQICAASYLRIPKRPHTQARAGRRDRPRWCCSSSTCYRTSTRRVKVCMSRLLVYMYVYMYMYISICIYLYVSYIYTCVCVRARVYVYMYDSKSGASKTEDENTKENKGKEEKSVYTHTHKNTQTHTHTHKHTHTHTHLYLSCIIYTYIIYILCISYDIAA
jgi:hypothetical protein